jgi:hypothetical protein
VANCRRGTDSAVRKRPHRWVRGRLIGVPWTQVYRPGDASGHFCRVRGMERQQQLVPALSTDRGSSTSFGVRRTRRVSSSGFGISLSLAQRTPWGRTAFRAQIRETRRVYSPTPLALSRCPTASSSPSPTRSRATHMAMTKTCERRHRHCFA